VALHLGGSEETVIGLTHFLLKSSLSEGLFASSTGKLNDPILQKTTLYIPLNRVYNWKKINTKGWGSLRSHGEYILWNFLKPSVHWILDTMAVMILL
jgi:hypothetical protein